VIVGPAWPFVGLVAIGLALLALIPGCGLVVVGSPSGKDALLSAPRLAEADPRVDAVRVSVATVSPTRVRRQLRRGALRIRATGCDGVPSGTGFAVAPTILVAQRDVLPGAGALKVASRAGKARAVGATRVYHLGQLAIAGTAGRLPRGLPFAQNTALGASVAVVGYPLTARPRLLRGVVVDRIAGTRFGIRGPVLRLTAALGRKDPGGPVIDARGRIVGVAFATDPQTGFAVAAPLGTLRSAVSKHALESLPPCDGA
jgi:S1-C subfamily serine protease